MARVGGCQAVFLIPHEPRAELSAPSAVASGLRKAASTTKLLEIVKLVDVEAMPEEHQIIPSKFARRSGVDQPPK